MNFGAFLDNNSGVGGGGGGAKIVADIPYNDTNNCNNITGANMTTTAIAHSRLIPQPLAKSMFSSPGLSLALVRASLSLSLPIRYIFIYSLFDCLFILSDLLTLFLLFGFSF